jgi:hypothetical protein
LTTLCQQAAREEIIKPPDEETSAIIGLEEGYVTHGIHLLTYISDLKKIKENATARRERLLPPLVEPVPPLPSLTAPNTHPVHVGPFSLREPTPGSSLKSPKDLPGISANSAQKGLRKSVAALSAFQGYDQATDQALDVLTDATSQYLTKFCNLLRTARDREMVSESKNGFTDQICRVYEEMGCGSVLDIRSYYKNSITGRHKSIGETAQMLSFECQHLHEIPPNSASSFSIAGSSSGGGIEQNGILSLMDGDPDNIPEIHFPSSDEGENGPPTLSLVDHNAPQIETGLQMLQSLEQSGYGNLDSHPGAGIHHGGMVTPPPASANSGIMGEEDSMQQPMSHDSNAALLLATVSPGSSSGSRKRRKTSDRSFF